ncbi:MAG TPA: polyprenol monophosphomannose synthase [Anaerolineaceae bacterium]
MKLIIVIPTYNEAENLPRIASALFSLPLPDVNLLVVDDNSPDGTGQIAEDLGKQYNGRVDVLHRAGKQGLGTAYIQGFQRALASDADAICQMDADFSHPPEKVVDLAKALECSDVAVGSRYIAGGSVDERWSPFRKFLSGFGNLYARTILGMKIKDITGGFRMWKRATLLGMPLERVRSNGYVFQVEMAYVCSKLGYKIQEVPIYFADRRYGKSKMSFRIQAEAALRVWQLLPRYRDLK